MITVIRNALSHDAVERAFELYRNTTNAVEIDGEVVDRHTSGQVGVFMLSKYTSDEFSFIWDEVQSKISDSIGSNVELVYARILKYNRNCFIPNHLDSYESIYSDISVIIQLGPPENYIGGEMIVGKQLMDLNQGDMVFYTYDVDHEVKKVKSGIRYVINLRCKTVK